MIARTGSRDALLLKLATDKIADADQSYAYMPIEPASVIAFLMIKHPKLWPMNMIGRFSHWKFVSLNHE
jgi:hypothetical protein